MDTRNILRILGFLIACTAIAVSCRSGHEVIQSMVEQDKASLRSVGTAVAAYIIDWSYSPQDLESMTKRVEFDPPVVWKGGSEVSQLGPYLEEIPHSAFMRGGMVGFFHLGFPPGRGCFYIAWTPGPDKVWDITAGEELRSEMHDVLKNGRLVPWLTNRIYDPTNGTHSSGDIIRLEGLWTDVGHIVH